MRRRGTPEIDLVGYEGGNAVGEHAYTLTVTDIATGWTENRSCKARITTGAVSMEQNLALNTVETEAGFILTCQSHPTTPTVAVDYDS